MIRKGIVILGLSMFSLSTFSQENKMLSLKQCIETGIANNLDVKQTELQVEREEIDLKQSKLNMLPDLNGSAGQGTNRGRSIDPFTNTYINQRVNYANYGVSSGVTLFNGLSLQNYVKQNKLVFEAAKMESRQAKDNLTINIILAYLQVLNNEDVLQQSINQAALTTKQVERLEILDKNGAVAPYLLTDLKGQYATDQLNIISAQNALETSRITLSQLMNVPYDKNMKLERWNDASFAVKYDGTAESVYTAALNQFAQVKAVDLRTQSAEKTIKAIKGELFPTLSLNGNVNTNYSSAAFNDIFLNTSEVTSTDYVIVNGNQTPVIRQQNNYRTDKIGYGKQLNNNLFTSVSVNLRIPIFNALQTRNRIKQAKIDLRNSELIALTTKTQLQQFVEQAFANMNAAGERYRILLDQVTAYRESYRAAEIRFHEGVGTPVDYLTAKNNLDRANINLLNAKYDFILRTKILDYYHGVVSY